MRTSQTQILIALVAACPLLACQVDTSETVDQHSEALSWDHVLARITASDATVTRISNPKTTTTLHGNLTEDFYAHKIVEMELAASPPFTAAQIAARNAEIGATAIDNTNTLLNVRHSAMESLIAFRPECDAGTCLSFTSEWQWPLSQCRRATRVNDRIEVMLTEQMPLGAWTYFRFFIKVGTDTQPATTAQRIDRLVSQVWQVHSGAGNENWRGPIFQANLKNEVGTTASGFHLVFSYRNDEYTTDEEGGRNYNSHEIHNSDGSMNWITPGVWASFHFAMKPVPIPLPGQPAATGAIHIFRDKGLNFIPGNGATPINSGATNFNWGYRPVNNGSHPDCSGVDNCVANRSHMRVGLYANEATIGPALPRTSLLMDSVKATTDENYMPGY